MYNRQYGQRRPPSPPQNYSGNAFYRVPPSEISVSPLDEPNEVIQQTNDIAFAVQEEERHDQRDIESPPEIPSAKHSLPMFGGKLFPRGLGSEELLILALILMTSQSEDQNDILLYLILLLFC